MEWAWSFLSCLGDWNQPSRRSFGYFYDCIKLISLCLSLSVSVCVCVSVSVSLSLTPPPFIGFLILFSCGNTRHKPLSVHPNSFIRLDLHALLWLTVKLPSLRCPTSEKLRAPRIWTAWSCSLACGVLLISLSAFDTLAPTCTWYFLLLLHTVLSDLFPLLTVCFILVFGDEVGTSENLLTLTWAVLSYAKEIQENHDVLETDGAFLW